MKHLRNWTAKRSGATITVEGFSDMGNPLKLGSIVKIEAATPFPIATDSFGNRYELGSYDADTVVVAA